MTTDSLRPASSVGYQVNRLARLFEVALRNRIAAYGVVPGQFPALLALYERDRQTQRELSEVADVDQSTMAKTLARMRRDGLVRDEPDPDDGRRIRYQLTPRARALEGDLAAAGHEVIAVATRGIPPLGSPPSSRPWKRWPPTSPPSARSPEPRPRSR